MKQATRYKRMLLKQRRKGVQSLDQVKPDPYMFAFWMCGMKQVVRLVRDDAFAK